MPNNTPFQTQTGQRLSAKRWLPVRIPRLSGFARAEDLEHLATGKERFVFRSRLDPTRILKVLRPDAVNAYAIFRREYRALRDYSGEVPCIPRIHGLLRTEYGMALVSEAVLDEQGEVAPHLRTLAPEGQFSDTMLAQINDLIAECYKFSLPIYDLSPMNIVFGKTTANPISRPNIIDGYGDRNTIPLKALFPRINFHHLDKKIPNLERYSDLVWNPVTRSYSNGPYRQSWRDRRLLNERLKAETPPPRPTLRFKA